jgi:hypothetical protein
MRIRGALLAVVLAAGLGWTGAARADQRHDWILAAGDNGTFLTLDFVFGALQGGVEHRLPIYGFTNQLTLRATGITALPFGGAQADVDLRIVNLTLGMSAGGESVWRNMTFEPGEPMHRKERREREAAGEFNTESFGFWEGRASLAFPMNDYVVVNQVNAWRISGAPKRSFDYLNNVVHDGRIVRNDFQIFLKHRDYGGIAPMVQLLHFPLDDDWRTQVNYGFMMVTRAGLVGRDDLLVLQMLFHSGSTFGGTDNSDVYGAAILRGPMTLLLAYRTVIEL